MPTELGYALIAAVVVLVGVIAWLVAKMRAASGSPSDGVVIELRTQLNARDAELKETRDALASESEKRARAETQVEETRKSIAEQRKLLEEAETRLKDTFKALSSDALRSNREEFESKATGLVKPLREALERYEKQIREMEHTRKEAYGGLAKHLGGLADAQKALERETHNLTQVLRTSSSRRGKWGEITLKRVVELAGLSQYCDFDAQKSVDASESAQRPDLVVRLPGGRSIVIDSKVPLEAYMDAMESEDPDVRKRKLAAHAAAVRAQVKSLSQKSYWSQFDAAPEFVILFLPGESFFSAAAEADRSLIEDGIKSRVMLATPTTLIMALLTVAHSWQQQQLAENAQRIAGAGTELYDRLCTFTKHLDGVGKGIRSALERYNDAVGSWERRVEPGARKLKELGAAKPDQELPALEQSDIPMRQLPPAGDENDESGMTNDD